MNVLCLNLTYIAMFSSTVLIVGVGSFKLSITTTFNCRYYGVRAEKWICKDSWAR